VRIKEPGFDSIVLYEIGIQRTQGIRRIDILSKKVTDRGLVIGFAAPLSNDLAVDGAQLGRARFSMAPNRRLNRRNRIRVMLTRAI